jgi:nucleoside-diphosphate-sugar epimerase
VRVLLTGGAGDLGRVLVPRLVAAGHTPVVLDIRPPARGTFIQGSIVDRERLPTFLSGSDAIVHIAGWHGIHEANGEKNAHDFFDLNVRGTFEVFEAATSLGIDKIVHISTTSVHRPTTLYARSKILGEQIVTDYASRDTMNAIILRPRGFIPHWNRSAYTRYRDWAQWFWRGAVHIDDVASAVMGSLDVLTRQRLDRPPVLTLDSAYEYTDAELADWDANGPGSTFRKYYDRYYDLTLSFGLDPTTKPYKLDISEAVQWIGYKPTYSLTNLLAELATHGDKGPPEPPTDR